MTTPSQMRKDSGEYTCERLIIQGERLAATKLPPDQKREKRRSMARRAWEEIEGLMRNG
ncbi:MAG TPA: hypothetical protein VF699_13825 [Caulobacteraceae bacterium]|jgi:hypothetical protein